MTAQSVTAIATGPLPVLAIAEPHLLAYSSGRNPLAPMIRVGGVIGFICVLLTGLLLPVWAFPKHAGELYCERVHLLVPALQLIGVGSGLTLIVLGRRFAGCRQGFGFKLAIAINFIALIMAGAELRRNFESRPTIPYGWVVLHNSI